MPCYTIKKTSVNVSTMDLSILAEGLRAAGFDVRHDQEKQSLDFAKSGSYLYHHYANGVLTVAGNRLTNTPAFAEHVTGEVKRAYSAQTVRHAAQQFGWKLSTQNQHQFVATKRR